MAIAYVPFTIAVSGTTSGVVEIRPYSRILGLSIHGTINASSFSFLGYVPDSGTIQGGSPGPGSQGLTGGNFDKIADSTGSTITLWSTGQATSGIYSVLNGQPSTAWFPIEGAEYVKVVASAAQNGQAVSGYIILDNRT